MEKYSFRIVSGENYAETVPFNKISIRKNYVPTRRLIKTPPPLPPPLYSKPKKLVYSHKYISTPQIHLLVHNRRRSCVFINFEHTSYLFPVFLLWSLNKKMLVELCIVLEVFCKKSFFILSACFFVKKTPAQLFSWECGEFFKNHVSLE